MIEGTVEYSVFLSLLNLFWYLSMINFFTVSVRVRCKSDLTLLIKSTILMFYHSQTFPQSYADSVPSADVCNQNCTRETVKTPERHDWYCIQRCSELGNQCQIAVLQGELTHILVVNLVN